MEANWQIVASMATALGVIIASGTLAWQIRRGVKEDRLRRSEFALRETVKTWEEAYGLLRDGNNNREIWIAAARTIELAANIRRGITHAAHLSVLEVQEDRYRRAFGEVLGWDNPTLKGSFFYGGPMDQQDIDEAARASTRRMNGRPQISAIPEGVLLSIWQFSQYPKDYEDPLPLGRFSDHDIESGTMQVLWPGLVSYLRHIHEYRSINGNLVERQLE